MRAKDYDAVIVGAGIIGVCTAFELAKRGYRTLNVDRRSAPGRGSTRNSSAIIRFHYSTPEGCAMARESYYHWLDWGRYLGTGDDRGLARYVNTGCLVFKTERNRDLAPVLRLLEDLCVVYEELDAAQVEQRFPFLDVRAWGPPVSARDASFGEPRGPQIRGAAYLPESGYVDDPSLACRNVRQATEAKGGAFRFGARVSGILRKRGRVAGVELEDGLRVRSPIVVNAAGPHSAVVNRMADVLGDMNVAARALKQEVCHLAAPSEVGPWDQVAPFISDGDIGCYSRPTPSGRILVGSEDPPCDAFQWVDDPDSWDPSFTAQWETQALRLAQRVRGLEAPRGKREGLVELYDVTGDWIPIYDRSSLPGYYMAIGTSGNQFKNGPVAGKLMAKLIEESEAGRDHDQDPVKMRLSYTKRELDIGCFSRLRRPNPDSSYSVIG